MIADADCVLSVGDARRLIRDLADGSVGCVVTSPPYLDARPEYPTPGLFEYPDIFGALARVVRGAMVWNVGRRWRDRVESLWWVDLIAAARGAGWEHRDTRLWLKPNANPINGEVFTDAHEYLLLFAKPGTPLTGDAVRLEYAEGSVARLKRRHVSHISVKGDTAARNGPRRDERRGEPLGVPNPAGARAPSFVIGYVGREKGNPHPAPMPLELAIECVRTVSDGEGPVLDPFAGSGTTLLAARLLGLRSIGFELSREYAEIAAERLAQQSLFAETLA